MMYMENDLLNYAEFIATEIRNSMIPNVKLYRTGNMKSSVSVVVVDDNTIDIIVATDYASYTNERGKHRGWVQEAIDRASRCYSEKVDNTLETNK